MNTKQGNLENIILNALWNLEENYHEEINVANIQFKINVNNKKWAYTTVKTVLDRLVEKKLVTRVKQGKKYCYRSKISRESAGETAIKNLLKRYYNDNFSEFLRAIEKVKDENLLVTTR
ncbi:MAG: hypothetical protein A2287_10410 [Candidatus Melainabacteria bacterium RIFOXYA12_FULL_32_12]|nr:MAG: hypothetical protein A2104_06530 [Candidatus Melainabacteria bacterium GWF2_32_7]OGI22863.1 MAG: hypothetical protein A2255_05515 [Candidatus Melainabacteria bacterium RIFOXYA2_FULL_32_9]OGI29193.1 MAG: hypothetical protein A2287_10410 [Candidatus Melainabacteria bacterium RIFOXYA12_FULL_32_12]